MTGEISKKKNGVIESQRGEINRALARDEQHRRDQQLLHEQLLEQNRELREAHEKSLSEMEELKRFQGSTFDTISRRKLIEDRDIILELTGNGMCGHPAGNTFALVSSICGLLNDEAYCCVVTRNGSLHQVLKDMKISCFSHG